MEICQVNFEIQKEKEKEKIKLYSYACTYADLIVYISEKNQ